MTAVKTSARVVALALRSSEIFLLHNNTQYGTSALSFLSSVFRRDLLQEKQKLRVQCNDIFYVLLSFIA